MRTERIQTSQDGITLLITLLLMGVLLGVSTSLLNITIKQLQLSGIALASETAFQAADAGMECIVFHDFEQIDPELSPFYIAAESGNRISNANKITCFQSVHSPDEADNSESLTFGKEQLFKFSLHSGGPSGDYNACTMVGVYKFEGPQDMFVDGREMREGGCPAGAICTVVQSRGYNVACDDINSGGRVVEREYTQVY